MIWAVVDHGLHRPPAFVGVLQTASGIGAVLGGLVAAAVMRRTGERGLMAAGLCAMTVAAVPLLLLGWTPTVVLAMALNGAGIVGVNVGGATLVQRLTPRELLGRVNSAVNVTMLVPQTAAIAVGASLVDSVDFRLLLVAMAVLRMFSVALLLGRGREAPEPLEPAIVDASAATEAPSQR